MSNNKCAYLDISLFKKYFKKLKTCTWEDPDSQVKTAGGAPSVGELGLSSKTIGEGDLQAHDGGGQYRDEEEPDGEAERRACSEKFNVIVISKEE